MKQVDVAVKSRDQITENIVVRQGPNRTREVYLKRAENDMLEIL
jgi:hypothetical protein